MEPGRGGRLSGLRGTAYGRCVAARSRLAFRSTYAMSPNEGTNAANAINDGTMNPPSKKSSPIAREKDIPKIEPMRATRT